MKLLQHAVERAQGLKTARATGLRLLAVLGALLPTAAFAAEGENVKLAFSPSDTKLLYTSLVLGVISILAAIAIGRWVLAQSPGSAKMQEVGGAIKAGALAYLRQQVRVMSIFVIILFFGLAALYWGGGAGIALGVAGCFICGVAASYIAGFSGMILAVNANMRVANAALSSYKTSLEVGFRSGAVAGLVTVGMGLIGATLILLLGGSSAMTLLVGFGFGGSLAALFMRVGGGIFTKAADVGADLVGKVEAGIPEDDPRNPATIADNVGDNVGDCAGMAADIFESYEVTLVAAIVLGAATASIFDQPTWMRLVLFALMARGVGIVASIIGILTVRGTDDLDADPLKPIRKGFYTSAAIASLATLALAYVMMGGDGKSPIVANSLHSVADAQKSDTKVIQDVRARLAKASGKQPYEVDLKDVVKDPEVQKLGFEATDDQMVGGFLAQPADRLTSPDLKGMRPVSEQDLKEMKIPALSYAIQAPQKPGVMSANRFVTIGSLYSATGDDQLIAAKLHLKMHIPGRPAEKNMPPSPGQDTDRTLWQGPLTKAQLELGKKNLVDQVTRANGTASIDVLDSKPMQLYVNPGTNELAVAIVGEVQRPYTIALAGTPLGSYYPIDALKMNQIISQAPTLSPGQAPKLPDVHPLALATDSQNTVPWYAFWLAITFGVFMAFAIEMLTDYYVSTHKKPVQEVAGVSSAGAAPMIIQGFAYALESSVFMVFAIVIALLVPLYIFAPALYGGYILSFYGIALVGLGLLTTTGYVLAMDTFGPISDNAQGVYEMSGEAENNENGAKAVQRLDAAGNTTKALTKGFAIATAVVAAVALFHSYLEGAQLDTIGLRLDMPEIFLGLLVGGAAPFLFSAFAINAVGRASFELINEVRRQFKADAGIMLGTSKPDYGRCVAIVTAAAQKELLGPGILAISLPVAVAFGFSIGKAPTEINGQFYNLTGAQALGGFLAGAILTGQLMAVLLANSGGMWDNAKKLIEDGLYGGKGSDAHKAGVVCDTVGDPFKDTAGPALNPLIKVMNLVALLLAPVIIRPYGTGVLATVTIVCLVALSISIYFSKKGSMSSAMQEVAGEVAAQEKQLESAAPSISEAVPNKRRITVEEEEPVEPKP